MVSKTQKLRVLFIMHMPPPVHGAAMVGKYIHDSKIVNETFDCRFENMMLARNLEDIGKGGVRKIFDLIAQLKRFKNAISAFKPDVVYITPNAAGGAFYKDFIVVQYIKRCLRKYVGKTVPVLLHYHNKGVSTRHDKLLDNFLYKRFFKNVKVMLLANALKEDVKKYVKACDVMVCPNGIPQTLVYEPKAERNNDIPQILFLSNLIISKGVIVLIDALKLLKDQGLKFHCIFVGGETDEINARKFAELLNDRGLDDSVEYVGKKYGDEKKQYFENADVFAFPSFYHNEAFPLVNLEAMEYKLPVISTNEGGIPDMVVDGENGLICERNDSKSLADALRKLILDRNLRIKLGESGYKRFKSEFTLECFEKNFTKCLLKIIFDNTQK